MSDKRQVVPAADSPDPSPSDLGATGPSKSDASPAPPSAETGASRRRNRLAFRIPDDEVGRPRGMEPEAPPSVAKPREALPPQTESVDEDAVLTALTKLVDEDAVLTALTKLVDEDAVLTALTNSVDKDAVVDGDAVLTAHTKTVDKDAALTHETKSVEDALPTHETRSVDEDAVLSFQTESVGEDAVLSFRTESVDEDALLTHEARSAIEDVVRTPRTKSVDEDALLTHETRSLDEDVVVTPRAKSVGAGALLTHEARPLDEDAPLTPRTKSLNEDAVLTPMRIITINPSQKMTLAAREAVTTPPLDDDSFEDEPTPLVRRIQRGQGMTPVPAGLGGTLSFPPVPQDLASSPVPELRESAPSSPPVTSAPIQSAAPSFPPPQPRVSTKSPLPAPPAQAAPVPEVASARIPKAESRPDAGDGVISLDDDLLAVDATPSSPDVVAGLPAVRPRLPSHPPMPPTSKRAPPAERPSKPPLVIVPPHMGSVAPQSDGPSSRRKGRFWWEELFNDDYLRATERLTGEQLAHEVRFIEESLGIERGGAVLDLACGTGQHAIELARHGYRVVAFDLSLAMLARAGDEAQERNAKLNFVQGDMREMSFVDQFDGVYCWNTSFGFFEEEKNAAVIDRIHDSLKPGGLFLLDVVNRDFVVQQSPSLAWFEGDGCVCMDEMVVDSITSRMRVKRTMMLDDGRSREIECSLRIYSLHELGKMLHDHGFKVCEVSGRIATPGVFFGQDSPRTIILAEKR